MLNLTPHAIDIKRDDGTSLVIPASGQVARVRVEAEPLGEVAVDGEIISVRLLTHSAVENLPEPQAGVRYIVSLTVAQTARRPDLLVVDHVLRDETGRVLGCRGLGVFRPSEQQA